MISDGDNSRATGHWGWYKARKMKGHRHSAKDKMISYIPDNV